MNSQLIHISEMINIERLQTIQDYFSKATDLGLITIDAVGKPVTKQSGFSDFCKMLRRDERYGRKCEQCDALGGMRAAASGKPFFYLCHAGAIDLSVPIIVDGKYLGAIMAGQTKATEELGEQMALERILDEDNTWREDKALLRAHENLRKITPERLFAAGKTLYYFADYIVEQEYINAKDREIAEKNLRLTEEGRLRTELEKNAKEIELKSLTYQMNPHFLFNILNTIGRLAYLEHAEKTEEIVYAFSDMFRYILKKDNVNEVRLKDEINHVENYLKLHKIRLGDRLHYKIDVAERFFDISCPFMVVQPVVENSVKYVVEAGEHGGHITVSAEQSGVNQIAIRIKDDGDGIPRDTIKKILSSEGLKRRDTTCIGLSNINNRLKYLYGDQFEMEIKSENKACKGTEVIIRIPC